MLLKKKIKVSRNIIFKFSIPMNMPGNPIINLLEDSNTDDPKPNKYSYISFHKQPYFLQAAAYINIYTLAMVNENAIVGGRKHFCWEKA